MDERDYERIDRYLRKEMSDEESLNFEQDALNDPELRKETELTYRIKRSLTDRQQKLYSTAHWERKKTHRAAGFITIISIAAMLIAGFFFTRPTSDINPDNNLVASVSVAAPETLTDISEATVKSVKKSISEGKDEMAIAEVTKLEEQNVIPTLNDVSDGRFVMSNSMGTETADVLRKDAYELHWLKIQSLITIGEKAEAMELLKSFVTVDGKYKATADSLLNSMK